MFIQSIDPPQTPHPSPFQPQPRTRPMQPPMVYVYEPPRWEYRILEGSNDQSCTETDLNRMGDDGWELVGMSPLGGKVQLFFKRQKR